MKKRTNGGPPYAELESARSSAESHFPGARIHALWTPASIAPIHVEVWADGRADVIAWTNGAPAR